ncbi:MAG TPA: VOC family protein [Cytophagaceae bacterium]
MTNDFWLNLPVKDINRSKAFFNLIGFKFNDGPGNTNTSAAMIVGNKNTVIMLFEERMFKGFVNQEIADTKDSCEVLLSFSASSKDGVDEIARLAVEAGGASNHVPKEMEGYMYGCVFSDLDGHKWNVLYMKS